MVTLKKFTNLISLLTYFKDEQVCREYLAQMRWSGLPVCPYSECGHDKVFTYANGKVYKCAKCKKQFSVRVGTIFEDSKIPLQKWFAAIYLITSHKKGISSLQLHRDLGVTQKTAWFLLHRVRTSLGLNIGNEKFTGTCEADETFIGGKNKNRHASKKVKDSQGRSFKDKSPVAGIIERGGELRAKMVPDTTGFNLKSFICKNIAFGSPIHTDEWWEGFWSLLKRGVVGIYHSMSDKHLQKYIDEFVFRYNSREFSEADRFDLMLNNIATHITYKQLINAKGNRKLETQQGLIGF
ncbi:MAG TPA: IS1595 family transposase [Bacteroidia bacterium]|jgi:transposase-like protein|nr:IS1595 family transposase [Bacteroidia bacterium]